MDACSKQAVLDEDPLRVPLHMGPPAILENAQVLV